MAARSQLQYRASFALLVATALLATASEFVGVWALFARFGTLKGWTLPEAAVLFGTANIAFSLADAMAAGFDHLSQLVKSGEFDRLLVRPRVTLLQVAGQELALRRLGRLVVGLSCVTFGLHRLPITLDVVKVTVWLLAVASTAVTFYALFVLQAAFTFLTTETLEVTRIATYGGCETAQYPMTVYRPWLRRLFTFVVPLAVVTYWPLLIVVGRKAPDWAYWLPPVAASAFLAVAIACWNAGVARYGSTGS